MGEDHRIRAAEGCSAGGPKTAGGGFGKFQNERMGGQCDSKVAQQRKLS